LTEVENMNSTDAPRKANLTEKLELAATVLLIVVVILTCSGFFGPAEA
jgi:hypothetical protein